MKKLVFATHNLHKLEEIKNLLGHTFEIIGLDNLNCYNEIPEPYNTLEENAMAKADFIYNKYNLPCFADDTGLEVYSINNEPGVFSARYAGPGKNSDDNIEKLLKKLENKTSRDARFRTIIAYHSGETKKIFEGIAEGKILIQRAGTNGFGYDPVFQPSGFSETFAEMDIREKNKITFIARNCVNKIFNLGKQFVNVFI
jgi:XTP/dITP diphosphohydrolase